MYAYAKAVNKGYIDAKYRAVAEKALQGLKDKLLVEKQDGTLTLTRCCQVGGLGGHPYRDGSFEYYIGEKMRDNDAKATGPFIMGCLELENKTGMNRLFYIAMFAFCAGALSAQDVSWPEISLDAKPAARWWWMGSAVDKENLTRNLEAYVAAGMGTMEITPIYGVQGNDAKDIPFLSPRWMQMLQYTESEASRLGMQIDMNTGTGWPFGGPEVGIEDAACKLFVTEYRLEGGNTLDKR